MKIDSDSLKSLLQSQSRSGQPGSRQDCPDPEKIIALLRSELPRKKAGRIIDHISRCPDCREESKFLIEVLRAEKALLEELSAWVGEAKSASPSHRTLAPVLGALRQGMSMVRGWSWKAVSLAAVAFLAIVLIFSSLVFRHPEKYRAETPVRVELIEPVAARISRSALVFRWKSLASADSYTLGIFEENLKPVWKSQRITRSTLILPTEVSLRLSLNKPYFWMVTAFAEGQEVASALGKFVLTE